MRWRGQRPARGPATSYVAGQFTRRRAGYRIYGRERGRYLSTGKPGAAVCKRGAAVEQCGRYR
jgi:hypothetical protein